MAERPRFATSLDDPRLEADLLPRAMSRRALVLAGGGCSALTLALRYPDVAVTAFDPDAAQIEHVRAKMAASAARDLARLNVEDASPDGLNASGALEAVFRAFRERVQAEVAPRAELLEFFGRARPLTELDAMVRGWIAKPAWAAAVAAAFGEPLREVLGTEEERHLDGSWAEHVQKSLERGLRRDAAPENPFLSLLLLGMYGAEREPYYARNGGPSIPLELVHGRLADVPDLGGYDLVSLSSSLDRASDEELRETVATLTAALRPGAAVFVRQLGCRRSIRPFFENAFWFDATTGRRFAERDRSLLHHRFEIAVRR
jgi:S-adenosylmethionine-diacylglycerol 3-amino-3-carboxypropyl transferase